MKENITKYAPERYLIKVARSKEEVENIRSIWENMQWHPDGDIDHYLTVLDSRENIIRPHVIILYKNDIPEIILVARIENVKIDLKLGYKELIKPKVRSLTIGYGGILGNPSVSDCEVLIAELTDTLVRGEADVVFLQALRIDSHMFKLAKTKPRFLSRDYFTSSNLHWKLNLPQSYEEYFNNLSKETRARLRKESNRISKKFGNTISIKCYTNIDDIEIILRDHEYIASKTYHRGLGVGFTNNIETRRRYELALNQGILRSYIIYIDNDPVVFLQGMNYKNTFYGGTTGYDPQYNYYHFGTYILIKIFEDLCRDKNIEAMDFGLGDAEYKRIYCNESWQEATVYIFAPSFKGIMISGIRSSVMIQSRIIKNIIARLNLEGKIKTIWRNRLARKKDTS